MHSLESAPERIGSGSDPASSEALRRARTCLVRDLNRSVRRLKQYDSENEWVLAVIEAAACFVPEVAVFELTGNDVCLRGQASLNLPSALAFPLTAAAAFSGAVQSLDPVIALRTPSEVSQALGTPGSDQRAYVFPIHNGVRIAAFLFAPAIAEVHFEELELVASIAGMALKQSSSIAGRTALVNLTAGSEGTRPATRATGLPESAPSSEGIHEFPQLLSLNPAQRELHFRARRFARTSVAQMNLLRPEASQAGREQGNLYLFLQKEIDKARESYRTRFLTIPSMVDYLHLELVRTAADGDEGKLGADYPGQLV